MKKPYASLGLEAVIVPVFYAIAVWLWRSTGHVFYLFNFIYIGTAIGIGMVLSRRLPAEKQQWSRRVTQLMIGIYMLGFLGFIQRENMQIEGFWFYLFSGYFAAAVLHYAIAKIAGPLLFGRAWCGWGCWTAMILDLLPFRTGATRIKGLGYIRYGHFMLSLSIVLATWVILGYRPLSSAGLADHELYWLVAGNAFYYAIGTALAFGLRDNRAFCKYLCPITTFLKIGSRLALLKVKGNPVKCNVCGVCEEVCPMDIRIRDFIIAGTRVLSTECIFCQSCVRACPQDALRVTIGIDVGGYEFLHEGPWKH